MHVNPTLSQGLQVLLAASNKSASSTASTEKASAASNSIVPLSSATKNIAGQINAALFDQSAQRVSRAPAGMTAVPDDFGKRTMSDEEFRAGVIASMRNLNEFELNWKPDPTATDHNPKYPANEWRKIQIAYREVWAQAFEEAVASGNISIRRAQEVEGLDFKAERWVQIMEGRVVGQGGAGTYNPDYTRADSERGKDVIMGEIDGGDFYLTFDMPDYLKEAQAKRDEADARFHAR